MKPKKYSFTTFKKEVGGLKFGRCRRYTKRGPAIGVLPTYEALLAVDNRLADDENQLLVTARCYSGTWYFSAVLNIRIPALYIVDVELSTPNLLSVAEVFERMSADLQSFLDQFSGHCSTFSAAFTKRANELKGTEK